MAKRKKRRTSIRTAAGVAQDKYLERVRALRDDPLCVLPDCPEGDPKPIAKIRAGIERIVAGKKPGFFDRRDKGVLGAVVQSLPLAELDAVPRLLDHKVGGKRRFFLQRGHVARTCMLGVQNHDDPQVLLMAYREMAKEQGLHFFAMPGLVCSGETPKPPQEWLEQLATDCGATLTTSEEGWTFGEPGADCVRLRFRGGPALDVASAKEPVHRTLVGRYAGPKRRHPVEVTLVLDGQEQEPDRERLAAYRAGVESERSLLKSARL